MRVGVTWRTLTAVLLIVVIFSNVAGAIPPIRYLDIITSERPYGVVVGDEALAIILQRSKNLGVYLVGSGVYYEITLRDIVRDAAVLDGRMYVIFEESEGLAVIDIYSREVSYAELGYTASEITGYGGKIYVISVVAGKIIEIDAGTLNELRVFQVDLAGVRGAVRVGGGYLWALRGGLRGLTAIELGRGEARDMALDGVARAFGVGQNGRAWVLLEDGELLLMTGEGEVRKVASLETRAPAPAIAVADERAFLFDSILNKIVEINLGGGVEEERVKGGNLDSLAVKHGKVWFVDRIRGKVGWFSLSKPPAISDVNVEKAGESQIRVSAEIEDPDMDVKAATLVVTEYIEGRVAKNSTVEMERMGGSVYGAVYKIREETDRVDLKIVVEDQGGNLAVERLEKVNIRRLLGDGVAVTVEAPVNGNPGVDSASLPQLAAQLLLAIPLLGVLLLLFSRRRALSRRRKRR